MNIRLLGGLAALACTAVLWSGSAKADCWWTGETWACRYPPTNVTIYNPPYPYPMQPDYPSYYPFTTRYPGPKLN